MRRLFKSPTEKGYDEASFYTYCHISGARNTPHHRVRRQNIRSGGPFAHRPTQDAQTDLYSPGDALSYPPSHGDRYAGSQPYATTGRSLAHA